MAAARRRLAFLFLCDEEVGFCQEYFRRIRRLRRDSSELTPRLDGRAGFLHLRRDRRLGLKESSTVLLRVCLVGVIEWNVTRSFVFGYIERTESACSLERHIPLRFGMRWYLQIEGTTRNASRLLLSPRLCPSLPRQSHAPATTLPSSLIVRQILRSDWEGDERCKRWWGPRVEVTLARSLGGRRERWRKKIGTSGVS